MVPRRWDVFPPPPPPFVPTMAMHTLTLDRTRKGGEEGGGKHLVVSKC